MRKNVMIVLILIASITAFGQEKYSKVRIYTDFSGIKEILRSGADLETMTGKPGTYIELELSQSDILELADKGFKIEILIDDMSSFYEKRYAESAIMNNNSLKGINYTTPVNFNYGSMGGYLTMQEIYDELDEMAELFPNLISAKYTIGNTQTIQGRNIYAVRMSDNPSVNEDEPEVLYTSLTHAREPAAMQGLIWFMWYLLENYGSDQEITYLVDNLEMYFVPVVNPDGYEYNRSTNPNGGGMWRKNRRSTYGVDLNRNFGYMWGYDDEGSSPYTSDETYRGSAAFSEPETQILRDFCNEHTFVMAHNHHTYSNLLIIPWGYDEIFTPDDDYYRATANLMASENGYTVGQGWQILYVVNGDSNDWMYGEQNSKPKIFAYTQETGSSGFWPSQSEIIQLCEECYLSNLYLARFATPYAELSDNTPNFIPRTGYIKFNLKRMGISGNGNYTVTIEPDNNVFTSLGTPKNIVLDDVMTNQNDSIAYVLSNNIEYGQSLSYTVTVAAGSYNISKSFTKSYYLTETLLDDPGNTMNNWSTDEWSVTGENYHSPSSSITDSEGTSYSNYADNYITLNTPVDLTDVENPTLSFWAKWDIENDWDYVQLLISTNNGSSWVPVQTNHTNPGTGSFQPSGEPLFDASSSWVENIVDLTPYIGQNVWFRFELHSDSYVNADGFYFDDFTVLSTLSSPLAASLLVQPGCGDNSGSVTIYSTVNGIQTFYLRDQNGSPIDEWTGEADFKEFTGLNNGIFRAQVEQEGEISSLSDPVELLNVYISPVIPELISASNDQICAGDPVILSYTGGSGQIFEWFDTNCGEGYFASGNNITAYPSAQTTYYGRWTNACGNSDCLSLTISILDETEIISQPIDISANQGDNVSFSVVAQGSNLNYQWRKNSGNIPGANEATYLINNVQVNDQGVYDVIVSGDCGDITSQQASLSVSSSVQNINDEIIKIFPNPTNNSFSITLLNNKQNFEFEIKDTFGKTISKEKGSNGFAIVDLNKFPGGIYFIQIKNESVNCVTKIIKN